MVTVLYSLGSILYPASMCCVCTWHDDSPFRIQSLRVDLYGCHGVITCVPIQQVTLKAQNKATKLLHSSKN